MSVSALGIEDFCRYFRNSVILHPATGKPALISGNSDGNSVGLYASPKSNDLSYVPLNDFDWEHAQYPALGYRTLGEGEAIIFIARKPGRTTSKGLRPEIIQQTYPDCMSAICKFSDKTAAQLTTKRNGWGLANLVYESKFLPLSKAVEQLLDRKCKAVAYALEVPNRCADELYEFAVSVWPMKEAALALFFAGHKAPAALSKDGVTWDWIDKAARDVAIRKGVMK